MLKYTPLDLVQRILFDNGDSSVDCNKDNLLQPTRLNTSKNSPSLYLLNATSLAKSNALQHLEADLVENNIDIALITETWFNSKHIDNDVALQDFIVIRKDRSKRKGGGVCLYVRNSLNCSKLAFSTANNYTEILWVKCIYNLATYYIACCYHPPLPKYNPNVLIEELSSNIDYINSLHDNSVILIAGDFNQLPSDFLDSEFGLVQIVCDPTHGPNLLDKVYTNRPDIYHTTVAKSLVKTKHLAVYIHSDKELAVSSKRTKVSFYDLRTHNVDRLRNVLGHVDWSDILSCSDVHILYPMFLEKVKRIVNNSVPIKTVSMGPRDPDYVTPLVKSLLRKRYRLRRCGKISEADVIAEKINSLISEFRSRRLKNLESATPKELWASVKPKKLSDNAVNHKQLLSNSDTVNKFFANISYDVNCCTDRHVALSNHLTSYSPNNQCHSPPQNDWSNYIIEPYQVQHLLSKIKVTAAGLDNLPHWLFVNCSFELADVVAHIVNSSICSGKVPVQWLTAIVTPIAKVPKPMTLNDFRPISVTPILSRMIEKLIVEKYLRPAILPYIVKDQFAFRPTGSTTCALVYFMHRITEMLEVNSYVRCLLIDFSKAFDVVDHNVLIEKLCKLNIPVFVLQWIVSFLQSRSQVTKLNNLLSSSCSINRGVVQGSGLGPTLYCIMESDLTTLSDFNCLFKYADDTNLLVPEHSDVDICDEYHNIKQWTATNKMILNESKTKEIIFHRPNPRNYIAPHPLDSIERVEEVKLLGVYFNSKLSFEAHVKYILCQCSQRVYLMKLLRDQGLTISKLHTIFLALILSRITYAVQAWGGFLSVEQVGKINSFLRRAMKYGLTNKILSFSDVLRMSDIDLFHKMQDPSHCIFDLLPKKRIQSMLMRNRGHSFDLPSCKSNKFRNSFVVRCLFNFI